MITIKIAEQVNTTDDLVDALKLITALIEKGYSCGYYPHWNISGIAESSTDDN